MTAAEVSPPRLQPGRVVQLAFGVIGRHLALFVGLAIVIAIPLFIFQLTVVNLALDAAAGVMDFNPATLFGGFAVYLLCYVVVQGATIHATVADLTGRPVAIGESLAVGLREFLPLIGIAILFALGVFVGLILLVIPGIILMLMWSAAIPARVVERTGILDSFGRSRALTRGNKWRIFLVFVIFVVLEIALGMVIGAIVLVFGVADAAAGAFAPTTIARAVGETIVNSIVAIVGSALIAALYYELRVTKEGIGPEALASVFD
jgi:hypothetical protein